MKVNLINYTKNAVELLIFSKKTRLKMSVESYEDIVCDMSDEEREKELNYVFGTIGSSWEFVDYVFMIEGVTRAFTHQLVRHRVGVSFAQQAQRVSDMSEFEYLATGDCEDNLNYHYAMDEIAVRYKDMIKEGIHPQDARGILPTNILTNILMKINLRALSGLLNIRLCVKAQGEFQNVAREMRTQVLQVHPWAHPVLQVHCVQHNSCAFSGYEDCPIKQKGLLPKVNKSDIFKCWENVRAEYQPKGE